MGTSTSILMLVTPFFTILYQKKYIVVPSDNLYAETKKSEFINTGKK